MADEANEVRKGSDSAGHGWRRPRRILLASTAVGVLLLALALGATQTAAFRSYLRDEALRQINGALAATVSVGALDGTLWGSLILTDAALTLDGETIVAVERLQAHYRLLPLLTSGTLLIDHAEARGVAVHLVQDERGWNVERIVLPDTDEPDTEDDDLPIDIRLTEAILADVFLDVVMPEQRYAIRELTTRGSVDIDGGGERIAIESLTLQLPERDLQVREGRVSVTLSNEGGVAIDDFVLRTAKSDLTGRADIGAEPDAYDVDLRVGRLAAAELQRLLGEEVMRVDLSGHVTATGPAGKVALDAALTGKGAGTLSAKGEVDLASMLVGYDLRLGLDHLNLARLLGEEAPATDLTGTLLAKGSGYTVEDAAAKVSADLTASSVVATKVDKLTLQGSIADRQVEAHAELRSAHGRSTLNGTVDLARDAYAVDIDASELDPAPLLGTDAPAVRVNGQVTVHGVGFEPARASARGRIDVRPSTVGPLQISTLAARVELADGRVLVEELRMDSNAAAVSASGEMGVQRWLGSGAGASAPGSLRYRLQLTDLALLGDLAGQPDLGGRLLLEGTAGGSVDALDVDAEMSGSALALPGIDIGTLKADIEGRGVGTTSGTASAKARGRTVRAGGRLFEKVEPNLWWRAGEVQHVSVDLAVQEDAQRRHALRGHAEIGADDVRAVLEDVRLDLGAHTWTSAGAARIRWRDGRAEIDGFELRADQGALRVSGAAGTEGPQDLRVQLADLALGPFFEGTGAAITGTLSGAARLIGTAAAPELAADFSVADAVVEGVSYERVSAKVGIGGGEGRAGAHIIQSGSNELIVEAKAPLAAALSPVQFAFGDELSGSLRAEDVDLAIIDPLVPQVAKLRGTLRADLTLRGSPTEPVLSGPVELRGGSGTVRASGVRYDPVDVAIEIDGRSIEVRTLRIVGGDGTLTGGGQVSVSSEGVEGDVRLTLQKFPVFRNRYGEGITNGELTISGSSVAPVVAGRIETERLVIKIPDKLPGSARPPDPTIRVIGPGAPAESENGLGEEARIEAPVVQPNGEAVAAESGAPTPSLFDRATVNIKIRVPHNAWVRRSDTEIELRGALTVRKEPGEAAAVAGEISAVRGWYRFQGRKFTVDEGTVTLTGQDLNPLLDVTAVYQTGDYTVRARIGGNARAPTIKLESDPSLEQADILSVLVFGRPADQLSQGESQGLRERALGIASGYAASELRRSVADALGVDTLEITPGSDGLASSSASVGKYVTDDIFVSLAHKFAEQNVQQMVVQYFVTPRWTIETTADTSGDSGIDIFWRRRY